MAGAVASSTRSAGHWTTSVGEMPVARGYPASVFTELPALLERVGPGAEGPDGSAGQISGLFTVLVDGNDHDEPVADAVRGMLDGHVVMDRAIAEAGRYPAVDVLRSLSRTAESCASPDEIALARRLRGILATHAEVRDLVRLGAYHAGADPAADAAQRLAPRIEAVLR
jgi:flagellum-specific ATP synthase